MPEIAEEVVITVTVEVEVSVETIGLGCKYLLLISSKPLTTCPVSFNFTRQTVPKILQL